MSRKYLNDDTDCKPEWSQTAQKKESSLGLYRTLIAIGAVAMTVVLVLWVGYSSGTYSTKADGGTPKAVVILVDGLHPEMVNFASKSNKAPFITELVRAGSAYGSLSVPESVRDQLAGQQAVLTGLVPTATGIYSSNDFAKFARSKNVSSFLRASKDADLRAALIAPETSFSGKKALADGRCESLGILDGECVGIQCATEDTFSYCNGGWRIKTSEDNDPNTRSEEYIYNKLVAATSSKMDLVFIELSNFAAAGNAPSALAAETGVVSSTTSAPTTAGKDLSVNNLAAVSEMYVIDAFVGRVAALLASRSGSKGENWLLVLTSDGDNAYRSAPYLISNFKEGVPLVMKQKQSPTASLLDIFPTIVQWLGLTAPHAGRVGTALAL